MRINLKVSRSVQPEADAIVNVGGGGTLAVASDGQPYVIPLSGSGAVEGYAASGAPTATPLTSVAFHVDTATGTLYTWYSGAWH